MFGHFANLKSVIITLCLFHVEIMALDGNSEHVAHVSKKKGLFESKKNPIC